MADVRSGQWSKLYSESAPEFRQSVSMEQLQKAGEMWSLLGPYVSMGSAQSVSRSYHNNVSVGSLSVRLKFAKTETTGDFRFIKSESGWKLLYVNIAVPDALLPSSNK